jgi:hypothetical protein
MVFRTIELLPHMATPLVKVESFKSLDSMTIVIEDNFIILRGCLFVLAVAA